MCQPNHYQNPSQQRCQHTKGTVGSLNIKNFHCGTPMDEYKYMKIKLSKIPEDMIQHYHLNNLVHSNGYVYIDTRKGMPGLKQAS